MPALADARCPEHPDLAAVASCGRCGRFVCQRDAQTLMKGTFCEACAQRPEVNFLDTFRRLHEGTREGWAWFFGVTGLLALVAMGALIANDLVSPGARGLALVMTLVSFGALGLAFFFRVRAARWGLVAWLGLVAVLVVGFEGPVALWLLVVPALFLTSALLSAPTRLFFRLPVSVDALEREWRRRYDNPMARQAVSWAVLGALLPIFLPGALVTGLIALARVDPTAQPPIGGRRQALTALVIATLACLVWVGLFSVGWKG
jgi:hypothetical protein